MNINKLDEKSFQKLSNYEKVSLLYKYTIKEKFLNNNTLSIYNISDRNFKWAFISIRFILDFIIQKFSVLKLDREKEELDIYISLIRKILINKTDTIKLKEVKQFKYLIDKISENLEKNHQFKEILERSRIEVFSEITKQIKESEKYQPSTEVYKKQKSSKSIEEKKSSSSIKIKEENNTSISKNLILFIIGIIIFGVLIILVNKTDTETVDKSINSKMLKEIEIKVYGKGEILFNNELIGESNVSLNNNQMALISPNKRWSLDHIVVNGRIIKEGFFRIIYKDKHLDIIHVPNGKLKIKSIQIILNSFLDKQLVVDGKLGPKTKKAINQVVDIPVKDLENGINIHQIKDIFEIFINTFDVFVENRLIMIDKKELIIEIAFTTEEYKNRISYVQEELNGIGGELAVDGRFGMNTQGFINETFSDLNIKMNDRLDEDDYFKLIKAIHSIKGK